MRAIEKDIEDELTSQSEEEGFQSEEISLSQLCRFIDDYTRHSTDPLWTAAVCEQQAKAVRITSQDISRENLHMLIDTMLNAIDHLEKKWLDEQLQHEVQWQRLVPQQNPKRNQQAPQRKDRWHTWLQGVGNRMKRKVSYAG